MGFHTTKLGNSGPPVGLEGSMDLEEVERAIRRATWIIGFASVMMVVQIVLLVIRLVWG